MPPLCSFASHGHSAFPGPRQIHGQGDRLGRIFSVQLTNFPKEIESYFDFCI